VEGHYAVFGVGEDGSLLLFSPGGGYRPDLEPGAQWVRSDIVSVARDDGSGRVITNLPDRWRAVRPDGNAPMPQPLMHAVHAAAPDGFYWATPDRYEIRLHDGAGRVTRILRRPVEPLPVDASMIDAFVEAQLESLRRSGREDLVPAMRARLEEEEYGSHVPVFALAFVDRDERLWVGSPEWPFADESVPWSVFSREGRWMGDVNVPERVRPVDARGDAFLGIWRDELDVPHVRLYRFRSESAGG
jgi:hypothetical protein